MWLARLKGQALLCSDVSICFSKKQRAHKLPFPFDAPTIHMATETGEGGGRGILCCNAPYCYTVRFTVNQGRNRTSRVYSTHAPLVDEESEPAIPWAAGEIEHNPAVGKES